MLNKKQARVMARDERWDFLDSISKTAKKKKKKEEKKPKPNDPKLWSRVKSEAKKKFKVYPSAYANLWASKEYKKRGGGWRMSSSADDNNVEKEHECKTPGAIYHITVSEEEISIKVDIPFELDLEEEGAEELEQEMHDAMEEILAKFFKEENEAKDNYKGGLRRWLKEKWVNIAEKDKDGKHPPCGRSKAKSGAYPKCRPSRKVNKKTPETTNTMSKKDKESATEQKRRKERKNPKKGKGNKPTFDRHRSRKS